MGINMCRFVLLILGTNLIPFSRKFNYTPAYFDITTPLRLSSL